MRYDADRIQRELRDNAADIREGVRLTMQEMQAAAERLRPLARDEEQLWVSLTMANVDVLQLDPNSHQLMAACVLAELAIQRGVK